MAATRTPQESAAIIEWLFENSREVMFVIGADKRFKLVNPAFERETGWTESDIVGQFARDFIHPGEEASIAAHLQRLKEHGYSDHASRIQAKDGSWRWFEGRAQLMPDGALIGMMRNATRERERDARLVAAERTGQLLSQAAGIGTWSYEPEHDRIEWSQDILNLTGYRDDELADIDKVGAVLHPDEAAMVRTTVMEGILYGKAGSFEHRLKDKAGGWSHWRNTFRTEPRPGGEYALRGVMQNITELVQARDGAVRGHQQMLQLIESSPFAVAIFDRRLRYLVMSGSWREVFTRKDQEQIGLTLAQTFPRAPKRLLNALPRALDGEVVTVNEDRLSDIDGVRRWVRWQARPWRDAKGRVQGVVCYVDDITPLAETRKEAEVNARRLKLALNAADAGVYEIDHVQKTFWASPEFEKLVGKGIGGYEEAQTLRFPRFHPDDLEHVRKAFRDIRNGQRAPGEAFEARVLTPSGQERWTSTSASARNWP
jgi:PAS domain S-box-containing protein